MQQGDVFKVGDEDQPYLTEAVAPNGTIYARKFDLKDGPYGEPLTFKEDVELKLLFNNFQPLQEEEGWEYCEITHVTEWRDEWTGYEWFAAEITGAQGQYQAGTSDSNYFIRGEPILGLDHDKSQEIHQKFLNKLLNQGWEILPEGRPAWFQFRLKRKIQEQDSSRPTKPEQPGCLASLFGRRN